jgi:hypothetical protein
MAHTAPYREVPSLDQRIELLQLDAEQDRRRRRAHYDSGDTGLAGDIGAGLDAALRGYVAIDTLNARRQERQRAERRLVLEEQEEAQQREVRRLQLERSQDDLTASRKYDADAGRLYSALAPYERQEPFTVERPDPERQTTGGEGAEMDLAGMGGGPGAPRGTNLTELRAIRAQARTRPEVAGRMQALYGDEGAASLARLERYQPQVIERQGLRTPKDVETEDRLTVGQKRLSDLLTAANPAGPRESRLIVQRAYAIATEHRLPEAQVFAGTLMKLLETDPEEVGNYLRFHGQKQALYESQGKGPGEALRLASRDTDLAFPHLIGTPRGEALQKTLDRQRPPKPTDFSGARGSRYRTNELGQVETLKHPDPNFFLTPRGGIVQVNHDGSKEVIRRGDPRYMAIMQGGQVIAVPDEDDVLPGGGAAPDQPPGSLPRGAALVPREPGEFQERLAVDPAPTGPGAGLALGERKGPGEWSESIGVEGPHSRFGRPPAPPSLGGRPMVRPELVYQAPARPGRALTPTQRLVEGLPPDVADMVSLKIAAIQQDRLMDPDEKEQAIWALLTTERRKAGLVVAPASRADR